MPVRLAEQLEAAGMWAAEAEEKERLFLAAEAALPGGSGARKWFVPGRIEVLGKHTDYAGGRSLLCAAERGFCVVAQERQDSVVRIQDVVRNITTEFTISPELTIPQYGWVIYPLTVARRLARNFHGQLKGANIALASDLPSAAGMSSSSALLTAIYAVLASVNGLEARPEFRPTIFTKLDLAAYLGCIENGQSFGALAGDLGVGTFGGSEDHTAILCCKPGELSCFSFCPIREEGSVRVPDGHVFVIACSGVTAPKTGSAREQYNRVSLKARAVLEICRNAFGNFASLAEVVRAQPLEQVREAIRVSSGEDFGAGELLARFEQFWRESEEIIPAAVRALERGDLREVGELVDESQRGAEEGLGNQVAETIALARMARELGAVAASAFGAGFGGGVWALVPRVDAPGFASKWRERYVERFPAVSGRSEFFVTGAGGKLLVVSGSA